MKRKKIDAGHHWEGKRELLQVQATSKALLAGSVLWAESRWSSPVESNNDMNKYITADGGKRYGGEMHHALRADNQASGLVGGDGGRKGGFSEVIELELSFIWVGGSIPGNGNRVSQEDAFWKAIVDGADRKAGRGQAMQGLVGFGYVFTFILRNWEQKGRWRDQMCILERLIWLLVREWIREGMESLLILLAKMTVI